jgi:hypothetical protein
MKYYIIQEIGFEYNDEIYQQNGGDNGTPTHVYKNKADAEKQAEKLNFEKLQSEPICQYAYDVNDVISDVYAFTTKLSEITGKTVTEEEIEYDFTLPKMSLTDFNKIKDYIDLNFYQVVECDGE